MRPTRGRREARPQINQRAVLTPDSATDDARKAPDGIAQREPAERRRVAPWIVERAGPTTRPGRVAVNGPGRRDAARSRIKCRDAPRLFPAPSAAALGG